MNILYKVMNILYKVTAIFTAAAILASCASNGLRKNNTWRSESITSKKNKSIKNVEAGLISILGDYSAVDDKFSKDKDPKAIPFEAKAPLSKRNDDYKRTRDNVQYYLRGISEIKCGDFKTHSLAEQANLNLGLTGASTILGGVGALLSPESTTQALSGSAAMLTGIQSSINQNYYREKAFEIITKAIDVRRKTLLANIEAKRIRDKTDDNYSYVINDAIADMIEYNNACSVVAGLEELADSIKEKENEVDSVTAKQKLGDSAETSGQQNMVTSAKNANKLRILSVEEIRTLQK